MMKAFPSILLSLLLICGSVLQAQLPAIGSWRSHIPYSNPASLALTDEGLYVSNSLSPYFFSTEDFSFERFSKVNLLSDIGVREIYYHEGRDELLVAYGNSNVDVLKNDGVFNFSFIRDDNLVGDKNIYHALFSGDSAYLSCGFGIVVLDLEKEESPATYFFSEADGNPIRVNSTAIYNNSLWAATQLGLFKAPLSNPLLEDFAAWQETGDSLLDNSETTQLATWNDKLYALNDSTIWEFDGADWIPWYRNDPWKPQFMRVSNDHLVIIDWISDEEPPDSARVRVLDEFGIVFEPQTFITRVPRQAEYDPANNKIWVADLFQGLMEIDAEENRNIYNPNGPGSVKVFDMRASAGNLYVAPGDVNGSWNKLFNQDGFFRFNSGDWSNFNSNTREELSGIFDILAVTVEPQSGTTWFGSFGSGLLELTANGDINIYRENSALQGAIGDGSNYRVAGVALDPFNGNLWMANNGAGSPVVVRTPDNEWYAFDSGLPASAGEALVQNVVDDFGQVWFVVARGEGIFVYDPGSDLASPLDDRKKQLGLGAGNGNLHSTEVLCVAKDLDGEIWVGTEEGISVFFNPGAILDGGTNGDATQIFVQLGDFGNFLLAEEFVNDIAIDGANRKWIATDNGAFLVSEDGTNQLIHFTEENSPLLDNRVKSIAIDEITGEVFFGTDEGIISYRGEATGGASTHSDVLVYPNPVREDYNGPIAIKGLVQDADVKITDVRGRLVYQTTALGGQAIWDGIRLDNGQRAATGVYLVYSSDRNGEEKFVAKFVFAN
jgi:hypothetical protein